MEPTAPLYAGIALDDESALRQRYFDIDPTQLDVRAGHLFCIRAHALGYDSVQMWGEQCSRSYAAAAAFRRPEAAVCPVELISCDVACTGKAPCDTPASCALDAHLRKYDAAEAACPLGLTLRTGVNATLPCQCNRSHDVINCVDTHPRIPPPIQTEMRVGGGRTIYAGITPCHSSFLRPEYCDLCEHNASSCAWNEPRCVATRYW